MFHSKPVAIRQRPSVPPLLILVAMLICILVPSPLSIPKPLTPVFRSFQGDHQSLTQRPFDQPPGVQKPFHAQQSDTSYPEQHHGNSHHPNFEDRHDSQQQQYVVQRPVTETLPTHNFSGSDGSGKIKSENNTAISNSDSPPSDLKPCSHVVLFSAPRHGSTWFIDSVEGCSFTRANNGTFGTLNAQTEIWNGGQFGVVRNISKGDAVHYVVHNMSLKFFPTPWKVRQNDAMAVIDGAHQQAVPFVMLTRRIENAFKSLVVARETRVWNRVADNSSESIDVALDEEEFADYNLFISTHFDSARHYLESRAIPYDSFDYDVIKSLRWIILPKSRCYVPNCNFDSTAKNSDDISS